MAAAVALQNVSKRYGKVVALRDVSFNLSAGETVALVGHNGAGKTTLLKLMLGLVQPTAGSIRVLGEDPAAGQFAARRRLGYLPENVAFNSALTGRETLAFYARLKGEPVAKSLALLDRVGLGPASTRRIGTYSKGMRQRLGLAQALIGEPLVLLFDEPTTGLDPALRLTFYDIVAELHARGATVVLSSHALTELEDRASRVVIVNRGIAIADGSIDELRRRAPLPTRIHLKAAEGGIGAVRDWLGPAASLRQINGSELVVDAAPARKLELLRRFTAPGAPISDIDVIPPTLEDLYAHFVREAPP